MQFSELLELIYSVCVGPTDVFENCEQAQSTIGKMKDAEENFGQGKIIWNIDKYMKDIIDRICNK